MRALAFPEDEVVGTLDWAGSWTASGPVLATGSVEVPEGAEISLNVTRVEQLQPTGPGTWTYQEGVGDPVDLRFLHALDPKDLHSLTLRGGTFLETSMQHLPHIAPGLRRLYLVYGGLSDRALPFVAQLTGLTYLQTFGNLFTDAEVQQLASLKNLEWLYLEEETLTAAGFRFASSLPNLKALGLDDVQISKNEMNALRSEMPGVRVSRGGDG